MTDWDLRYNWYAFAILLTTPMTIEECLTYMKCVNGKDTSKRWDSETIGLLAALLSQGKKRKEIAEELGITPNNLSLSIKRLRDKGLLERDHKRPK